MVHHRDDDVKDPNGRITDAVPNRNANQDDIANIGMSTIHEIIIIIMSNAVKRRRKEHQ